MTTPPILSERPPQAFRRFVAECTTLGLDASAIGTAATAAIRYHRKPEESQELERRWYRSLDNGAPDYGVYFEDLYLADLWACWMIYSRPYLRNISAPTSLPDRDGILADIGAPARVVDLGCGLGYTAAALKLLLPSADVVATNIPATPQYRFAERLARDGGFRLVPAVEHASGIADLVFASEYFEHFEAPVDHLNEILGALEPRLLLIANTFGQHSIGHFPQYKIGSRLVDGRRASRLFNDTLRAAGYCKIETRLWNNRPAYWKRLL